MGKKYFAHTKKYLKDLPYMSSKLVDSRRFEGTELHVREFFRGNF